jgi:hypothetical protein
MAKATPKTKDSAKEKVSCRGGTVRVSARKNTNGKEDS